MLRDTLRVLGFSPHSTTMAGLQPPVAPPGTLRFYYELDDHTLYVSNDGSPWIPFLGSSEGASLFAGPLPTTISINGQSNAASEPPVTFGFSALVPLLGPDLVGWNFLTGAFQPIRDGGANALSNVDGQLGAGQIGTRLMRAIADAEGKPVRLFAAAATGNGPC